MVVIDNGDPKGFPAKVYQCQAKAKMAYRAIADFGLALHQCHF